MEHAAVLTSVEFSVVPPFTMSKSTLKRVLRVHDTRPTSKFESENLVFRDERLLHFLAKANRAIGICMYAFTDTKVCVQTQRLMIMVE